LSSRGIEVGTVGTKEENGAEIRFRFDPFAWAAGSAIVNSINQGRVTFELPIAS